MPPLDPKEWKNQVNESLSPEDMPSGEQQYWEKRSIYRVPACRVTKLNSKAYRPQAVSFGHYNHDEDHLCPMDDHKHRVLLHFLRRFRKPLDPFLESLKKVVRDLEASYEALDPKWKKDTNEDAEGRYLQLMITDGCFMLEILWFANGKVNDYGPNDPISSNHGKLYILPVIRRDMLLLENQLPMLVLDQLVTVCYGKQEDDYINGLILQFTGRNNPSMGKCLHVLDVFRKNRVNLDKEASTGNQNNACMRTCLQILRQSHQPPDEETIRPATEQVLDFSFEETIPPATELHEHGIQFEKSGTDSLKDISFARGVLRLPVIVVDDTTESMFLNLIAFEGSHVGAGTEVTSYICFMDNLIDKGQDVALLRKKRINNNYMGSDEAVAKLFNSLAQDLMLDRDSSLCVEMKEVREYCKKRRHKWRANLMHTYFRNPWVIFSLVAAFILFGLTAIQTVFTVLRCQK